MNLRIALGVCVLLSLIPAHAQQSKPAIVAEGGQPDDRASARVLYWNTVKGWGGWAVCHQLRATRMEE